jgi:hypothetical protein
MASRACALVCLIAGVAVARPAAAGMTLVFRAAQSETITFRQEGNRVRVDNPSGKDAGEALIFDLETKEQLVVYDDARAYFDLNKLLQTIRNGAEKPRVHAAHRRPAATYRPLHESKIVNGFSCEMFQRAVAGRVEAEVCFSLWGDAVGPKEDYAWFDAFFERLTSDVAGKSWRPAVPRSDGKAPGLAIWTSTILEDGTRDGTEILTITREPLPAAIFHAPSGYKEVSAPLAAGERSHGAPTTPAAGASQPATAPAETRKISSMVAILLGAILIFGLMIHTTILHLAANVLLREPRFRQALVAAVIIWVVMLFASLFRLPSVVAISVGAFATFGGLKISYGASIGRTLALSVVSGLIAAVAGYAVALFFV